MAENENLPPVPPSGPSISMVSIEDEMRQAYLDYSMSVIIGRALPDVRDGLKPVHRRILYAMFDEGLLHNRRYSKCAGVVGEVLKKYHPHGDASVYDALVRLAQPWNMRYMLVDGQGNFGSVDGDSPAAYRYTESRLDRLAEFLLADIEKDTVEFGPNFDDSHKEPLVLPARFPNLLVNGSEGIAVGMATKMPPHNLGEVIDATIHLINSPDATISDLMGFVPGPDFPTAAFIYGREGLRSIYETGRGRVRLRSRTLIETDKKTGRETIIVNEIPYQVNKARLIEKIAELIKEKKIEGISDLRDESDRDGMRIVVELKRDANSGIVMNNLFQQTEMETTFSVIMLSIDGGQPRILNLKEMLDRFIGHRRDVVTRRCRFELRKAEEQIHIVEALGIAEQHVDRIVQIIRSSRDSDEARKRLQAESFTGLSLLLTRAFDLDKERAATNADLKAAQVKSIAEAVERDVQGIPYRLSERQAQAILDLRLGRLTGLEREKIEREYAELFFEISWLKDILAHEHKMLALIVTELKEVRTLFADPRRTEIIASSGEINELDLIKDEEMVVTVSHTGYVKRNPISLYQAQKRGGRGKTGAGVGDEDFVEQVFIASTHSYMLVFTDRGRLYWLRVHEIPQAGRGARGKAIINLVQLLPGEKVEVILPVRELPLPKGKEDEVEVPEGTPIRTVVMFTRLGIIKRTALANFSNVRAAGLIALGIDEGDELVAVRLSDGGEDVLMGTAQGMANRFPIDEVRPMGRGAYGVKAITLDPGDRVVSAELCPKGVATSVLTVTANGYGKRSDLDDYRLTHRGGKGVIDIKTTDRNGEVVNSVKCVDGEDVMIITNKGMLIRTKVGGISVIGRNTQGVRLINLSSADEKVVSITKLPEEKEAEGGDEPGILDEVPPEGGEGAPPAV
jgi:DNA gyrase subunit A